MHRANQQLEPLIDYLCKCAPHTSKAQLTHKTSLVEYWEVSAGYRILEIGCGQGDTTIALAHAVGNSGHVIAIDKESPNYGTPTNLKDSHDAIGRSPLGKYVTFHTRANILDSHWDFPPRHFDMAVFSNCSWYMDEVQTLKLLFARVRPWCKRLGFAEWHPVPENKHQFPHLLASILQSTIRTHWPDSEMGNVASLITSNSAKSMAESTGWKVLKDQLTSSSTELEDGKEWEIAEALDMADKITSIGNKLSSKTIISISSQAEILDLLSNSEQLESLPSHVFLAE